MIGDPFFLTALMLSVAVLLQSVELLCARQFYADATGIWRAGTLRRELGGLALTEHQLALLLYLRIALAIVLPFYFSSLWCVVPLVLLSLAVSVRWRGLLNGGSDYMTVVLLSAFLIRGAFPDSETAALVALIYIAAQSALSYWTAGLAKLCSPNWRSGAALHAFLKASIYPQPATLLSAFRNPLVARAAAWGLIIFELCFPLALFSPLAASVLLPLGALFHLTNSYLLGLSRFFWIWIATYPAVWAIASSAG